MKQLSARRLVSSPRRRWIVLGVAAVLIVIAVFGLVGSLNRSPDGERLATSGAADSSAGGGAVADEQKAPTYGGDGSTSEESASRDEVNVSASLPLIASGQYLVRSGQLTMVVARGGLERAVDQIFSLTRGYGGYVLSSSVGMSDPGVTPYPLPVDDQSGISYDEYTDTTNSSTAATDNGQPYAWITVRVPADRFDEAILRFKKLGTVREVSTTAEDVTSQVVDIEARLSHYRAVLQRLLSFLDKANTVGAALAVQNRIDETELTVEQLTAQLKQIKETVAYSTLSVSLSEKTPQAGVIDSSDTFWGSIKHSLGLIADGARYTFVALGAALPFIALGVVVLVALVLGARRRRRRRGPSAPASATPVPSDPAPAPPAAAPPAAAPPAAAPPAAQQ